MGRPFWTAAAILLYTTVYAIFDPSFSNICYLIFDPSASATLWTHQEQLYGVSVQTGHPLKTKTGKILGILGRYVDEFFSVVWESDLSMPYYQGFSGRSEIRSISKVIP